MPCGIPGASSAAPGRATAGDLARHARGETGDGAHAVVGEDGGLVRWKDDREIRNPHR